MVAELLEALAEDEARTFTDLAGRLETDIHRLRLVVDMCRQLGYIESSDPRCDTSCSGCGLSCGLSLRQPVPAAAAAWWQLTERGRVAVTGRRQR